MPKSCCYLYLGSLAWPGTSCPSCNPIKASTTNPPESLWRWEMKEILRKWEWKTCVCTGIRCIIPFLFPLSRRKRSAFPSSTHTQAMRVDNILTHWAFSQCSPWIMPSPLSHASVFMTSYFISSLNTPNYTLILPNWHYLFCGFFFFCLSFVNQIEPKFLMG